jgi:hypothetical protein
VHDCLRRLIWRGSNPDSPRMVEVRDEAARAKTPIRLIGFSDIR